jgi:hypothetical protein
VFEIELLEIRERATPAPPPAAPPAAPAHRLPRPDYNPKGI